MEPGRIHVCVPEWNPGCNLPAVSGRALYVVLVGLAFDDRTRGPFFDYSMQATDGNCTAENVCRNCVPWGPENCTAVETYPVYHIEQYGVVSEGSSGWRRFNCVEGFNCVFVGVLITQVIGEENMKAEIYARGPIACGVGDP